MASVRLIETDRCPPGKGVFVSAGGRELAVFHLTDPQRFAVIDNSCPHASGNLSGGEVTSGVVSCPSHQWKFDLRTGVCPHSPLARVQCYPAEVRGGSIWVNLPRIDARQKA